MTVNYKNVYDLIDWEQAIFVAQRKVRDAQSKVMEAQAAYRLQCAKVAGCKVDDLEFSNDCCMAKGICAHVYHIKVTHAEYGHHENKCIFCGCDNVHDLY